MKEKTLVGGFTKIEIFKGKFSQMDVILKDGEFFELINRSFDDDGCVEHITRYFADGTITRC